MSKVSEKINTESVSLVKDKSDKETVKDERVDISTIAREQTGISMPIHKAFWRYKRWASGKLVTREEYKEEFIKFKER